MSKTILIVDDSASTRPVVNMALKGNPYVIETRDGKDATAKLSEQKIHLLIGDVNVPNMEDLQRLKLEPPINSYASPLHSLGCL